MLTHRWGYNFEFLYVSGGFEWHLRICSESILMGM